MMTQNKNAVATLEYNYIFLFWMIKDFTSKILVKYDILWFDFQLFLNLVLELIIYLKKRTVATALDINDAIENHTTNELSLSFLV